MKIEKQIFVSFSESEIVNISKVSFKNVKHTKSIIDFQVESLLDKRKISNKDFEIIRDILIKVKQ